MCGNGGRCVARFAFLKGIAGPEMTFMTLAGPIAAEVRGRIAKIRMPRPSALRLDVDLPSGDGWLSADFINTGVPHVVIRVEDLEGVAVRETGRWIRYHDLFAPAGTNANFIRVTGPGDLAIRTYERGVEDETLACGTGAMAAALVSAHRGLVASPTRVRTRGGEDLVIHVSEGADGGREVWLEGATAIVYRGELGEEAL